MVPVQAILPAALAALIRKTPLTDEKVAFAWRTAVGPAIAAATEVTLDQGVLRVRARDRAWQRELERSAATVRGRLDDLLGAGVVRARLIPDHRYGDGPACPRRALGARAGGRRRDVRRAGGAGRSKGPALRLELTGFIRRSARFRLRSPPGGAGGG